jgi:hypothetical protein
VPFASRFSSHSQAAGIGPGGSCGRNLIYPGRLFGLRIRALLAQGTGLGRAGDIFGIVNFFTDLLDAFVLGAARRYAYFFLPIFNQITLPSTGFLPSSRRKLSRSSFRSVSISAS